MRIAFLIETSGRLCYMPKVMRSLHVCMLLVSSCLLCSCATERIYKNTEDQSLNAPGSTGGGMDLGVAGIDIAMPGGMGTAAMLNAKQIQAQSMEEMMKAAPVGEIFFTDPDNPDADIKEIDDAFSAKVSRKKSWQQSYAAALREARRNGKPILIWFHDSKNSPASISLGREVLTRGDFDSWSNNNLVRLRYDRFEKFAPDKNSTESESSQALKKELYVKKAFEHFGVKGTPAIVMLSPDGQRLITIKGYKTNQMNSLMQQIKHTASIGVKQHEDLKKRLAPRGYRTWTGKNDNRIFAQLTRFDEKSGNVWFKEFDGTVTKTKIDMLSPQDQAWLTEQASKNNRMAPL